MGTRSTIRFIEKYDDGDTKLVNIYQQFDGYIEGVGYGLAKWLINKTIVHGLYGNNTEDKANGTGCLSAQFIRDFKTNICGLYIVGPEDVEEYNYDVIIDDRLAGSADDITIIRVTKYNEKKPIFVGRPSELLTFREAGNDIPINTNTPDLRNIII